MFEASVLRAQNEVLQRRVLELEDALRRLLRHEPWPGGDTSERDYNHAASLLERPDGAS